MPRSLTINPTNVLQVPLAASLDRNSSPEEVSAFLDTLPRQKVNHTPWAQFPYKPDCSFAMAHTRKGILLKYFVSENDILARFKQPNDWVHLDSCVEFFVAFDDDPEYYNLEFNALGTCYLGYGLANDRDVSDADIVRKITSCNSLSFDSPQKRWELTLIIPNEVFYHHHITDLSAIKCKANFYKCGDELPVPHYLTWNNVESPTPNFHLPQFFGEIKFKSKA